jgi:hypothetical protein
MYKPEKIELISKTKEIEWMATGNDSMGYSVLWGYGGALRNFIGGNKTPRTYKTRDRARSAGARTFGDINELK